MPNVARPGTAASPGPRIWTRPTAVGRPAHVNRPVAVPQRAQMNPNFYQNRWRAMEHQRNLYVRPAPRPYAHAPYVHGGHRYYAYHPYAYHAYRPFYWGRGFYPFGTFVASLGATALFLDFANTQYGYDDGTWYQPVNGGYDVVTAPVGAVIPGLPSDAELVAPDTYYYGGTFYAYDGGRYRVIAPWAGLVVSRLPPGGEEVMLGAQRYVRFGSILYQPIFQDGAYRYEVVEVR